MDAVDTQILTELIKDAQMSFTEISQKIGVSRETVRKRFERMKKEGVIHRITILIDGHKIGEQGTAFLMLTCLRGADKKVIFQKLKVVPDVCMVTELMGTFDFFVWARIRDIQQIAQIVSEIRKYEGIDRIETMLLPQTYFSFSLIPKISIKCDGIDLPKK
ncbi:MAG: Lrp/AsnC family transcriptional regulator [Candidatus Bathyarchaeia archaeon]|jgi:DNA-binding Lrp family transcriptional regulator